MVREIRREVGDLRGRAGAMSRGHASAMSHGAVRGRSARGPISHGLRLLAAFLGAFWLTAGASAQSAPEGRLVELPEGGRAPFAGTLMEAQIAVWLRGQVDELRLQVSSLEAELARTVAREGERASVLIEVERARTAAAESRTELRDGLWQARAADLTRQLRASQDDARPSFWEQPGLWYGLGVATVTLIGIGALVFANAF